MYFFGPLYTWFNHQPDGFDKVLINDNWLPRFANSIVEFLTLEVSDHCLALIQLQHESESPLKLFRFFNFWTKHSKFLYLVEKSLKMPISRSPISVLLRKLK